MRPSSLAKRPRTSSHTEAKTRTIERGSVERNILAELFGILAALEKDGKIVLKESDFCGATRWARALIRWLHNETRLNHVQINQATDINAEAVKKIISNVYRGVRKRDDLAEDDRCLALSSPRLAELKTWQEANFGSSRVREQPEAPFYDSDEGTDSNEGNDLEEGSDSDEGESDTRDACMTTRRQTRSLSQIPSRPPVRFASITPKNSAKRKRRNSDADPSTSLGPSAKRHKAEVDALDRFFKRVGYTPVHPAELIKQGLGCREIKSMARMTEKGIASNLQLFPFFKKDPVKGKLLARKLISASPDAWILLD